MKEQELCNAVETEEKVLENSSGPIKMRYITLEEGTDFRKIAQIMTKAGYQMNHATARNVLMTSLTNLFKHISNEMSVEISETQIKNILRDQKVHEALSDILFQANQQITEEMEAVNVN